MRVGVVGAGAVGLTAAADLARQGADVTVYERDEVGAGATGRAAGIVYDAFAEDVDARVADRALERFRALADARGGDFRVHDTPYVWFATEEGETADAVRGAVERMRDNDRGVELVDREFLRAAYPTLRSRDVVVAAVARDAACVDPQAYVDCVAARAREAGADVRTGTEASVATDPPRVNGDRFDAVVVAAGAHTRQVLAGAGVAVPLKPYRVQALVTRGPATPIVYDATAEYYFRPHPRGVLVGDGTDPVEADPDDWDPGGDDRFVEEITGRLAERIVNFEADVVRAWAGLCVATPDRDPLLGEVEDGVYVAAGWQGHGFMRAPATGEAVAEAVLDGEGIPAFDPGRFSGDEEFDVVQGMTTEK